MTFEKKVAAAFSMSEAAWARHANPWSVWTRFTALPLLLLAAWSRSWVGAGWVALFALAALWTWINPRIFPRPRSTENWASRAVLGERVWMNRDRVPVPAHHRAMPNLLSGVAGAGGVFVVYGAVWLDLWPTLFGAALVYLGKLWFMDRMVWLYGEMKAVHPEYAAWEYDETPE